MADNAFKISGATTMTRKYRRTNISGQLNNVIHMAKTGYSLNSISDILGLYPSQIIRFLKSHSKSFSNLRKEGLLEALIEVEKGREHIYIVRRQFGFTPQSFYSTLASAGKATSIEGENIFNSEKTLSRFHLHSLEKELEEETDPNIRKMNALILEGKNINEIACEVGIKNRQLVSYYIRGSGLQKVWEQKKRENDEREEKDKLEEKRREVISFISSKLKIPNIDLTSEEITNLIQLFRENVEGRTKVYETDSIETKVEKHMARLTLDGRKSDKSRVRKLLHTYYEAQAEGRIMSFKELSETAEFKSAMTAYKNLKYFGLNSMNWETRELSQEEIELIERAKDTKFSNSDLLYFLGLDCSLCAISRHRVDKERKINRLIVIQRKNGKGILERLRYSDLSQIFEAKERGFTNKEISYLFDISPKGVSLALRNRDTYAPVIIEGLRTLYPERKITKPYLNQNP